MLSTHNAFHVPIGRNLRVGNHDRLEVKPTVPEISKTHQSIFTLRPNPHRTRARKFERKPFDVACVQCEHSHLHQQVPFASRRVARPVWIGSDVSIRFSALGAPFLQRTPLCEANKGAYQRRGRAAIRAPVSYGWEVSFWTGRRLRQWQRRRRRRMGVVRPIDSKKILQGCLSASRPRDHPCFSVLGLFALRGALTATMTKTTPNGRRPTDYRKISTRALISVEATCVSKQAGLVHISYNKFDGGANLEEADKSSSCWSTTMMARQWCQWHHDSDELLSLDARRPRGLKIAFFGKAEKFLYGRRESRLGSSRVRPLIFGFVSPRPQQNPGSAPGRKHEHLETEYIDLILCKQDKSCNLTAE